MIFVLVSIFYFSSIILAYGIYPEESIITFDSSLSMPSRPPIYSCSAIFDAAASFSKKDIIEGNAVENYEEDQNDENQDNEDEYPESGNNGDIDESFVASTELLNPRVSRPNSASPSTMFPPIFMPNQNISDNLTPKNNNSAVDRSSFSTHTFNAPFFQQESTPRRESVPFSINTSSRNSFNINTTELPTPKKLNFAPSFANTSFPNFVNQPTPSPVFRKEPTPKINHFEQESPHYAKYELNNSLHIDEHHSTYHEDDHGISFNHAIEEPVVSPEEYIRTVTQFNSISSATSAITSVKTRLKRLGNLYFYLIYIS